MVDLKAKPYCLPDEDVRWVEETIAGMTPEEKVGQLFFQLTASQDENYLRELMEKYHLGGCRYNPMPGAAVQQQNRTLQKYAKVPVFIACNTEAGGDGACADGTNIGSGIKIGATRNNDYAYALGKMANEEAAAIGCNMAFAPVCDIHYNWENTEIVTRAFGNDSVRVAQMSKAYMDGLHTIPGFACTAKHFPGNGLDFRDAHLSNNVNTFSVEEWDKTYGMVYKTLIDGGLDAIMGGCGVKQEVCKVGFRLAEQYGFTFVGGHPMAGTQFSGFANSKADMFDGAPMVVVPPQADDILLLDRAKKLLTPAGFAHLTVTTAEHHDEMIAYTSQMCHVISNAYVKSPRAQMHKGYSAGSYMDLTRVAWLNEHMWTDLFLENRTFLLQELDQMIGSLQEYREALEQGNGDRLCTLLAEGRICKEKVDGQ